MTLIPISWLVPWGVNSFGTDVQTSLRIQRRTWREKLWLNDQCGGKTNDTRDRDEANLVYYFSCIQRTLFSLQLCCYFFFICLLTCTSYSCEQLRNIDLENWEVPWESKRTSLAIFPHCFIQSHLAQKLQEEMYREKGRSEMERSYGHYFQFRKRSKKWKRLQEAREEKYSRSPA